MGSTLRIIVPFITLGLVSLAPSALKAQEIRSGAIDAYLLIDASIALGGNRQEVLNWTVSEILRGLLRNGDRLMIWSVAAVPQILFKGTLAGQDSLSEAESSLRSIPAVTGPVDIAAALRTAATEEKRRIDRSPIAFALLISCNSSLGVPSDPGTARELSRLLRFSRVDDYPGWKSIVVGLGMEDTVKSAAAAYMLRYGISPTASR